MNSFEALHQLRDIAKADDFSSACSDLVERWEAGGVTPSVVSPILRFMRENPELDFGSPGSLVHLVEKFYRRGYEESLIESVQKVATPHTVWMLNRLINGADSPREKTYLVSILKSVTRSEIASPEARDVAAQFLELHSS